MARLLEILETSKDGEYAWASLSPEMVTIAREAYQCKPASHSASATSDAEAPKAYKQKRRGRIKRY